MPLYLSLHVDFSPKQTQNLLKGYAIHHNLLSPQYYTIQTLT